MAGAGGLSPAGRRVRDQIAAAFPDRPLVVALSGGADSAVCAWAARESQPRARAVTIDHGLPASPQLVAAAASVARFLGLEHTVIAAPAADDEDSLRRARYAALEGAATPEEIIVTAHTADDQAETILGNILRGAGAAGLGGMPPGRGRFLRPMLSLTRAEVRRLAFE
ncbi:MAG TPA: ATP-binding protein, partial [Gemmatimonadales bacterium]|nr:ATP-binding protein [Gemmatimonadales bacterium]